MKSGAKKKFNHELSRIFVPFCAIRGLFFNLFQRERLYNNGSPKPLKAQNSPQLVKTIPSQL
jgi:hypothetical protein